MQTDPDTDLILTRTLKAPRELVWACWTQPRHLVDWFVPRPHRVVACDIDLRPGGRFDTTFEVEGTLHPNRGVFLELVPTERLVFTDAFTEGWAPAPDPFLTAIITLADAPGGTAYTALARHRSAQAAAQHREMGFFEGWGAVAAQLEAHAAGLAARTMVIDRVIAAPVAALWRAWTDPTALPLWWGPDGFSCRTQRIDLRTGGAWLFDMIGPDGTAWPNHHRDLRHWPGRRIDYALHAGAEGPLHAQASAGFAAVDGGTRVTLSMTFADQPEHDRALGFGAQALGLQTLGKLARFVGAA